jgi:hypothetical protein
MHCRALLEASSFNEAGECSLMLQSTKDRYFITETFALTIKIDKASYAATIAMWLVI